MKLSFDGGYGYTGEHARAMYDLAHAENNAHLAALVARSFPSLAEKEAMILAAYPKLRGHPLHDRSAR